MPRPAPPAANGERRPAAAEPDLVVLRLGHRPQRDARVTTHVGLVARAFGASRMLMSPGDERVERSVAGVAARFGGAFRVERVPRWRDAVRRWKEEGGAVAHLTMYGERLEDGLAALPRDRPLLVAVGAEKVPADMFTLADVNVAVGGQPHSEVAALAVFLDRLLEGEALRRPFEGALEVVPRARGKEMRIRP